MKEVEAASSIALQDGVLVMDRSRNIGGHVLRTLGFFAHPKANF